MAYATRQTLVDAFGEDQLRELADRNRDGDADDAVIDRALAAADAEIDGYIAARYALPLTEAPVRLVDAAAVIAFYRLHPSAIPDDVQKRYDLTIAFLRDVAKGVALLAVPSGAEPGQASHGEAQVSAPERVFTADSLRGWL